MGDASFAQTSFLGGEWSKYAQGRWDRPDYRSALNTCLNAIPIEQGSCPRRPGTRYVGSTRNGVAGRVIAFDFQATTPHTIEFTPGFLRFRAGTELVTTNDDKAVTSISTATPAVVQTAIAHNWATGDSVKFAFLGVGTPKLQNRIFIITKLTADMFSLTSSTMSAPIDGSTLDVGSLAGGAMVQRIHEVASPYTGTLWQDVRLIQAERQAILLHAAVKPYVLTATPPAVGQTFWRFTLAAANLIDGPYFDPPINGVIITPSAVSGVVTITLSFPAYSATRAYSIGDFVTDAAVNYRSLTDQNQGNVPAASATNWLPVNAGEAINNGVGFVAGDVGRLMRILDAANNWTWGKIVSLQYLVDPALAGSVNIGDMTGGGGLAAAFDGNTSQGSGLGAAGGAVTTYVGKDYSVPGAQKILNATLWPSTDLGFASATKTYGKATNSFVWNGTFWQLTNTLQETITVATTIANVTINLRAKATAPANSSDGTLLGQVTAGGGPAFIASNDQTTTWNFVWFEIVPTGIDESIPANVDTGVSIFPNRVVITYTFASSSVREFTSEAQFFTPPGTGVVGNGVSLQILGPVLASTVARTVWRLGVYSDNTGWPTCGTYHEGRLWLAGQQANRVDSSYSNQVFNFGPTLAPGTVTDANAISAIFNAPDVNTIFWLVPDHLGIIVGTLAGDWLIQATNNNNPLTPTSIQVHRFSKMGCANIEPRRADHTLIIVQRFRRKLFEYFADVYSGKFGAQNITWALRHATKPGIAEIVYQHELTPVIWARLDNGSLIGITYKRESNVSSQGPNFAAGHRHELGTGRTVESITIGPSPDGTLDSLCMVTNDATTNVRHVEMLTPLFEEGEEENAAWFLDDAVEPSSTVRGPTLFTINGLWHLNNSNVTVFAGGIDCGDWVVNNGSISMTYGDGVSAGTGNGLFTTEFVDSFAGEMQVVVGLTYTTQGQIVRPITAQESGARNGPALGKKRRTMQFSALLDNAAGISFGTSFDKLFPALFRQPDGVYLGTGEMFSGVYWSTLTDDYSFDSMICWQVSRPYSATVVAIEGFLHTQDR